MRETQSANQPQVPLSRSIRTVRPGARRWPTLSRVRSMRSPRSETGRHRSDTSFFTTFSTSIGNGHVVPI